MVAMIAVTWWHILFVFAVYYDGNRTVVNQFYLHIGPKNAR